MITILEINQAIIGKLGIALEDTAFSEVPFTAEEVKRGIKRPSIKVEISETKDVKVNSLCREKEISVNIYFFAKDRDNYKIDNIKMQNIITETFLDGLFAKEGFYIPIESIESEVSDTVLICSFELYSIELLPDDTAQMDPMEELEFREVIE